MALLGIGQYKTVDPNFRAVPFEQLPESTKKVLESNGKQFGLDALGYYNARGGVDASGYYGDSWSASKNLTPEEYAAAVASAAAKGISAGAAINQATDAKQGKSTASVSSSSAPASAPASTPAPTYSGTGVSADPLKLNGTPYTGEYNGITYINGVSSFALEARATRQSAYDSLMAEFNKYGLGSLVSDIKGLIEKDVPPSQFIIELRNTPSYQNRFKANKDRISKGYAALDEATYIQNEDAYRRVLRNYGLTQFDNDEYVSQFISNDIRPEELGERVVLAVNRLKMADPAITNTLRSYYNLKDADMVAAILDPKTQLPTISRQIQAAEIGTAAGRQGFNIGAATAEQLAAQGVTQAEAQAGYANIASILPTAEKLSDIYGKELERYGLAEAEQEQFNQLASAQRKRQRLVQREVAAFSGASGIGRTSLTDQAGGQF